MFTRLFCFMCILLVVGCGGGGGRSVSMEPTTMPLIVEEKSEPEENPSLSNVLASSL